MKLYTPCVSYLSFVALSIVLLSAVVNPACAVPVAIYHFVAPKRNNLHLSKTSDATVYRQPSILSNRAPKYRLKVSFVKKSQGHVQAWPHEERWTFVQQSVVHFLNSNAYADNPVSAEDVNWLNEYAWPTSGIPEPVEFRVFDSLKEGYCYRFCAGIVTLPDSASPEEHVFGSLAKNQLDWKGLRKVHGEYMNSQ
ncbi:hypothetical protein F5890DRAFT_1191950 [Lentinula detonsa]|uniref:Uncharacterized protein n=1 Tax=Lentinula detonsa TaxID=2804962 RepID=A0AA38Q8S2_9AGAR|nr:hypothetical protein F5890DRAFT_1191950 [Lentinula detonsa]